MKEALISFLLLSSWSPTVSLTIRVEGIDVARGHVRVCLTDSERKFLRTCDFEVNKPATVDTTIVELPHLPPGTYSVSLYHDIDDNGQLALNGPFGLPSEPYGFSNNLRTWFGPPHFDECRIPLRRDTTIRVRL